MNKNTLLLAGYGRADITADDPIPMGGYGDPLNRQSQGVLLPLYATCIALTDFEATNVLLYTIDHLCTNQQWLFDLRTSISETSGVPAENIMLSATHTHAGPDVRNTITQEHPYYEFFKAKLKEAAVLAMEDREESTVYYGSTAVENLNFVRHYIMADGFIAGDNFGNHKVPAVKNHHKADPEVQMIRFVRRNKKDILMMNFQVHPKLTSTASTKYGRENRYMQSSDVVGGIRGYFDNNTDLLPAYFQGAAGNLNPCEPYLPSPPESYKRKSAESYGEAFGSALTEAMASLKEMTVPPILKLKKMIFEAEAKNSINKREMELIKKLEMELNAITLGNIGMVTAPYEMFDTNGLHIKKNSPFDITFVITYANGRYGYIASEDTWDYKTADGSIPFEIGGLGLVVRGTGEKLADAMLSMLRELND